MKQKLYIIPGWEDTCDDAQYVLLSSMAVKKGYEIVCKNVNWKKPLSEQVFAVDKNAVIFGFSLGALLAALIAQKYPVRHLILASITPEHNFTDPTIRKELAELIGENLVVDIEKNLTKTNKAAKQTILYGGLEGESAADIFVPNTEHELTTAYLDEVQKLL